MSFPAVNSEIIKSRLREIFAPEQVNVDDRNSPTQAVVLYPPAKRSRTVISSFVSIDRPFSNRPEVVF